VRILKNAKKWPILMGLACLLLNIAGCGGDAYEKQFDDSMQHLKATGLPLGHEPAPPPQAAQPGQDQQQPTQDQQQQPAQQPQN
jgi:hypothetical protein